MRKTYDYIYYKLYRYASILDPNRKLQASYTLSAVVMSYSFALLISFLKVIDLHGTNPLFILVTSMLLTAIGIFYFNYRYFIKSNYYLHVLDEHSGESDAASYRGNIAVLLFCLLGFLSFMVLPILID